MMQRKQGMRISVEPAAAVLFAFMLLTDRTHTVTAILLAAVVHEVGHLAAAGVLRIPLRGIRLDLLGARLDVGGRVLGYGEEWTLCAAGPIFSLLFAAALFPAWESSGFARELSAVSLLLGILNLLPIQNFDGGRMLLAFLSAVAGEQAAERVLKVCSVCFILLLWSLAVYFLLRVGDGLSLLFFSMSLFLRFFAFSKPLDG